MTTGKFLFLLIILTFEIYGQTQTLENITQTKYSTVYAFEIGGGSAYSFNSDHDFGYLNVTTTFKKFWNSAYKFSLSGIPTGYPIKTIKLTALITQMEYTPNYFKAYINLLPNTIDLSNPQNLHNTVSSTQEFTYFNYGDTLTYDITSMITSAHINDGYFVLGVKDYESYNNSIAKIQLTVDVTYYLPVSFTADNNFTAPNSTHGKIIVDGVQNDAPYLISNVIIGTGKTLKAVTPQTDNQGYQRIWHTDSVNQSEWTKDVSFKSFDQIYPFIVSTDDDNAIYKANLRKVTNITFQNNFIGVGNGGVININSSQVSSPTASYSVVELNPITATAVSQGINNITYYFTNWSTGSTNSTETFYPTANSTITANFVGIQPSLLVLTLNLLIQIYP